jgi:hypothetical protein
MDTTAANLALLSASPANPVLSPGHCSLVQQESLSVPLASLTHLLVGRLDRCARDALLLAVVLLAVPSALLAVVSTLAA